MLETVALDIEPIEPTIGAYVSGVDLRAPLTEKLREQIHAAWTRYKVIFFRDQEITRAQHLAFARNFGEPEANKTRTIAAIGTLDEEPLVQGLQTERTPGQAKGNANLTWHCDSTYYRSPPIGTILRGAKLPSVGGDTIFADTNAAYENLSDECKRRIDGAYAWHDLTFRRDNGIASKATRDQLEQMQRENPAMLHPVVRIHPETGLKHLNVCSVYARNIDGWPENESTEMLAFLKAQVQIPEYQVRFRWKPNSLAFWDNRGVQHALLNDYVGQRHMERITILGCWE